MAFGHAEFSTIKQNRASSLGSPTSDTFRLQPITRQLIRPLADCADLTFAWPKSSSSRPTLIWETPGETAWSTYTFGSSAGGNSAWSAAGAMATATW